MDCGGLMTFLAGRAADYAKRRPDATWLIAFHGPYGPWRDGKTDVGVKNTLETGLPPRGTPKNYLMAWLLVMLKDDDLHGYEIMKELKDRFGVVTDPGTVYRALRQLERDGCISSWWDPKEQGPARRIYTLTEGGNAALAMWCAALQQYRSSLDAFFTMYSGHWRSAAK